MCQMSPLKSGANLWYYVIRGFENHPLRLVLLIPPSPPLRISQMFLHHRNHPSYATRMEEMYIPLPCLTRAFQSFSPTLPCCIQATRSRRFFTHRWQMLTLHN